MHCTADFCMRHYAGFSQIRSHMCTRIKYLSYHYSAKEINQTKQSICEDVQNNNTFTVKNFVSTTC